ncbi:hypothetical protein N8Z75_01555 [Crocinitomicaceae bacterium]|nr:hypothetical protein [Crocinitomicaceae bacterium]
MKMSNSTDLYKFQNLRNYLKTKGFPEIKIDRDGFVEIRGINFASVYKAGDISFDNEGLYLQIDGIRYKGYMFMQQYNVRFDPGTKKFPKFHLLKCPTIERHLKDETFIKKYDFAVSRNVNVQDRYSKLWYYNRKLDLCEHCKKSLTNSIPHDNFSTENFFDLEKDKFKAKKIRIDMNGYIFGWHKISIAYRKSKDFICENCTIRPKEVKHQQFWDAHHIEGDKLKNDPKDLKCLCVLCHTHVDALHENNMRKSTRLKQFIELYRDELIRVKNPYINLYL